MPKNIAIFVDGSGQGEATKNASNVRKLYLDAKSHEEDGSQVVLYLPGVGTEPCTPTRLLGLGFGFGSDKRIVEAYRFLCQNYEGGDHIYLFGFSRGAFAVRSLAGFVKHAGTRYDNDEKTLLKRYKAYASRLLAKGEEAPEVVDAIRRDLPEEPSLHIYFIGVWDTVVALGGKSGDNFLKTKFRFHDLEMPENVTHVRHALAAHEYRHMFEPVLFNTKPAAEGVSIQQVWFAGDHSDIGGSHAETDLGNVTLQWMAQECAAPVGRCRGDGQQQEGLKIGHSKSVTGCHLGADRIHRMTTFPPYHVRDHLTGNRTTTDAALKSMTLHPTLVERLCDAGSSQITLANARIKGAIQLVLTPGWETTKELGASCDDALVRFGVFLGLRSELNLDPGPDFNNVQENDPWKNLKRCDAINASRVVDCWLQHFESAFDPSEQELARCLMVGLLLNVQAFGERLGLQVSALQRLRGLPPSPVDAANWEKRRQRFDAKVRAIANVITNAPPIVPEAVFNQLGTAVTPYIRVLNDERTKAQQKRLAQQGGRIRFDDREP